MIPPVRRAAECQYAVPDPAEGETASGRSADYRQGVACGGDARRAQSHSYQLCSFQMLGLKSPDRLPGGVLERSLLI